LFNFFKGEIMGAMNMENAKMVQIIDLGNITADGDVHGVYLPQKSKITGVKVVDGAGIAADNTNYVQLKLMLGSTEIAELDTRAAHENGLAANVPKAANLVGASNGGVNVDAGSWLKANYNEEGTVAMTSAKMIVEYYPL
jgi:hypothetical protein